MWFVRICQRIMNAKEECVDLINSFFYIIMVLTSNAYGTCNSCTSLIIVLDNVFLGIDFNFLPFSVFN